MTFLDKEAITKLNTAKINSDTSFTQYKNVTVKFKISGIVG